LEDEAWWTAQTPVVRNLLLAGVIRNFEFVYELSFKMNSSSARNRGGQPVGSR